MSLFKKALFGAAVLGVVAMAFSLLGHKSVHAERVIPATPGEVWAVLSDPTTHSEWNPVIVPREGTLTEGTTVSHDLADKSGKWTRVQARVKRVVPERELNQVGGWPGILTFDHQWLLEPVEGGTRVVQHEEYRGLGVWFWDPSWYEDAYGRAIDGLGAYLQARR